MLVVMLCGLCAQVASPSPPTAGLAGSDDVENAQIAAAVDAVGDVVKEIAKVVFEKDEERKVQPLSQFSTVCVCVRMHAAMCTSTNTSVGVDVCALLVCIFLFVFVCVCLWSIHTTCPCYRLLRRKSWRRLNFQESCSSLRTSLPSRQPLKDGCSTRQGLHSPLAVPPMLPHAVSLTGFALPCTYAMV